MSEVASLTGRLLILRTKLDDILFAQSASASRTIMIVSTRGSLGCSLQRNYSCNPIKKVWQGTRLAWLTWLACGMWTPQTLSWAGRCKVSPGNTPNALQVRRPDRGILRCGHSDYYGDRCRATDLPIAGLNGFDSQETLQDRAPKIERESFGHVYIVAVNLRGHTVTSWSLTLTSVRRSRRRKQPD